MIVEWKRAEWTSNEEHTARINCLYGYLARTSRLYWSRVIVGVVNNPLLEVTLPC